MEQSQTYFCIFVRVCVYTMCQGLKGKKSWKVSRQTDTQTDGRQTAGDQKIHLSFQLWWVLNVSFHYFYYNISSLWGQRYFEQNSIQGMYWVFSKQILRITFIFTESKIYQCMMIVCIPVYNSEWISHRMTLHFTKNYEFIETKSHSGSNNDRQRK